jgi:hypothetical protein
MAWAHSQSNQWSLNARETLAQLHIIDADMGFSPYRSSFVASPDFLYHAAYQIESGMVQMNWLQATR